LKEILSILRHDLHKLKIRGFKPHVEALLEPAMKQADGIASWFSRNGGKEEFDVNDRLHVRCSYLLKVEKKRIENQINKKKEELFEIFKEKDPFVLHSRILKSKLLNKFSEARQYPYTSFKYHLLLTFAIYFNSLHAVDWNKSCLCENGKVESPFQVIYKDENREWALLPREGMSRVFPEFSKTWVRRIKPSIGGEDHVLDGLLSQIGSWSAALATIEDYLDMVSE
jgi:hypothetical protein